MGEWKQNKVQMSHTEEKHNVERFYETGMSGLRVAQKRKDKMSHVVEIPACWLVKAGKGDPGECFWFPIVLAYLYMMPHLVITKPPSNSSELLGQEQSGDDIINMQPHSEIQWG